MANKYAEIQLFYLKAEEFLLKAKIDAGLLDPGALREIEEKKAVYTSSESRLKRFQRDVDFARVEGEVRQYEIVRSSANSPYDVNFPDKELLEHAMSLNKSVYSANNNYPSIPNTGIDSLTSKITEESFLNSIIEIANKFFPSNDELRVLLPNEENPTLSTALSIWAEQIVEDLKRLDNLKISPSTINERAEIQKRLCRSPREVVSSYQSEMLG